MRILTRRLAVVAAAALLLTGVAVDPAEAGRKRSDPCRNGYVSLSFDDGPTASTPELLRALDRSDLRATFFNAGNRAEAFPSEARMQADAGHQIGNHTYDHPDLTLLSPDDLAWQLGTTQDILTRLTGQEPEFMRPPYGAIDDAVREQNAALGLTAVIWTVDTVDWSGVSSRQIVRSALDVAPGGFILLHDGYPNTVDAIPRIARGLEKKGLCAGRIVASDSPTYAWEGMSFNATVAPW